MDLLIVKIPHRFILTCWISAGVVSVVIFGYLHLINVGGNFVMNGVRLLNDVIGICKASGSQ
jgi:hypothetical protein